MAASTVTGVIVRGNPPVLGPDLIWGANSVVQWLVLRRLMRDAAVWPIVTTGTLLVFDLAGFFGYGLWYHFINGSLLTISLAVWTVVGLAQWPVLRASVRHAMFWVVASALAGTVYGAVSAFIYSPANLQASVSVITPEMGGAVAGAGYGLVTAVALAWLLRASDMGST